jgi:hypothetical protein
MGMLNFKHAQQILPTVWRLPDFFLDYESVQRSYRSAEQPWTTQYPNRLLTPWASNSLLEAALQEAPDLIQELTGHSVQSQVAYASLDLSGSQIMMHRLHPDIGCFIQVYMGQEPAPELSSVFCNNVTVNASHPADYADISEFDSADLLKLRYRPNEAWLMINQPRTFFGTALPVVPNSVRETVNLHFGAKLPAST